MGSHLAKSFLRWLHRPAAATTTIAVPGANILKDIVPSRTVQTSSYKSVSASLSPSHDGNLQPTPPGFTQPPPRTNPIDTQITNLPLVQSLRQNPSYKESRPHLTMTPSLRQSHFVAGGLSGSGKVTIAPYMWISKPSRSSSAPTDADGKPGPRTSNVTSVFHIGSHLCGHPGFVHGGLLGVMLDEVFSRCISASFPSGLGMTANLNIDYRKPAIPDRLYVLTAETVRVEGRKAYVEGKITMLLENETEGEKVVVTEGKALFVEPKFAEVCHVQVYRNGQRLTDSNSRWCHCIETTN